MKKLNLMICLMALSMIFWQCSDDETGSSNLSGNASKGVVSSANVTVYAFSEAGVRGDVLGTTTTDANGNFNLAVEHKGYVEVVVSGGSYKDEATGEVVTSDELRTIVSTEGSAKFGVTALTTIAAAYVNENAEQGLSIAIENANKGVAEAFGIADVSIFSTIAADLSMKASGSFSNQQNKYGAVQAGICQYIHDQGKSSEKVLELVKDMAEDFKDGAFDGKNGSGAIQFSIQITSEQALLGLEVAIDAFLASENNRSGYDSSDFNSGN